MLALFLRLSLAMYLTTCPNPAPAPQERRPPPVRYATPGETATGEVMKEEGDQLQLNTRPCNEDRTIVIFQKHYTKDPAGAMKCNGGERKLVQVVQR